MVCFVPPKEIQAAIREDLVNPKRRLTEKLADCIQAIDSARLKVHNQSTIFSKILFDLGSGLPTKA